MHRSPPVAGTGCTRLLLSLNYLFGDLDPARHVSDILVAVRTWLSRSDGFVERNKRPPSLLPHHRIVAQHLGEDAADSGVKLDIEAVYTDRLGDGSDPRGGSSRWLARSRVRGRSGALALW